jgi:hypothetical protein
VNEMVLILNANGNGFRLLQKCYFLLLLWILIFSAASAGLELFLCLLSLEECCFLLGLLSSPLLLLLLPAPFSLARQPALEEEEGKATRVEAAVGDVVQFLCCCCWPPIRGRGEPEVFPPNSYGGRTFICVLYRQ